MQAGVDFRKAAVIAIALLLLASVLVLASSCGQKSATGGTTPTTTGQKSIDSYLKELDRDANSVDPNGYGDSQLGNSALGL